MNKIMILAAATLLSATAAHAMPGAKGHCSGHEGRKQQGPNIEQMQKKLGLSEEQSSQVEAIFSEQQSKRQAQRQAHCEQRQQLHNEMQERLSSVLTDEQMQQLEAQREARQQQRQQRREERRNQRPSDSQ